MNREHFERYRVAVPIVRWEIELDVVCNRKLRLFEQTTLGLIAEGIETLEEITQLMGIDDPEVVRRVIGDLLEKDAVEYDLTERLKLSRVGLSLLTAGSVDEEKRFSSLGLRVDPVLDEAHWWQRDATLRGVQQVLDAKAYFVDADLSLSDPNLSRFLPYLREEIKRDDAVLSAHPLGHGVERFELLRLHTLTPKVLYRLVGIDVYRTDEDDWEWDALTNGIPDRSLTQRLRENEAEGRAVLPVRPSADAAAINALEPLLGVGLPENTTAVIGDDQSGRIGEVISSSEQRLILTLPNIPGSRHNDGHWRLVRQALEVHKALSVTVFFDPLQFPEQEAKAIRAEVNKIRQTHNRRVLLHERRLPPLRIVANESTALVNLMQSHRFSETGWLTREVLFDVRDREWISALAKRLTETLP